MRRGIGRGRSVNRETFQVVYKNYQLFYFSLSLIKGSVGKDSLRVLKHRRFHKIIKNKGRKIMKKTSIYLKIILTIIAILLLANLFVRFDITDTKAYAVSQSSEFQNQLKFLLGPKSNVKGNLMVVEYPGKGIYHINLDNIDNFFESKEYLEFTSGGKRIKLPKPNLSSFSDNNSNTDTDTDTDIEGTENNEG